MDTEAKASLRDLCLYFLRLGTIGFGGPVVLTANMMRDLVEARGWFSQEEYDHGLALAQLAPGPLAAQLAIYLGWAHSGVLGATLVAFAFIVPSLLMVIVLAELYVHFSGLPWIQGSFYGIGAAVIALMAQGSYKLLRKTVGKDGFYVGIAAVTGLITAITESERPSAFSLPGWAVRSRRRSASSCLVTSSSCCRRPFTVNSRTGPASSISWPE
jgi:chromate transporter